MNLEQNKQTKQQKKSTNEIYQTHFSFFGLVLSWYQHLTRTEQERNVIHQYHQLTNSSALSKLLADQLYIIFVKKYMINLGWITWKQGWLTLGKSINITHYINWLMQKTKRWSHRCGKKQQQQFLRLPHPCT